jgi:hypothetical protein
MEGRRKCSKDGIKYEPAVLPAPAAPMPVYDEEERREGRGKIFIKHNLLMLPVTVLPGAAVAALLVIREIEAVFVAEAQYVW